MKLTVRVFAFTAIAAAFAANFHSQKYAAAAPTHQVTSSAIPIPWCPPDGKTTCGLK